MRSFLLLIVLFACSSKEKIEPPLSPVVEDEKPKWIKYEGVIKTEFGEGTVVLSLMQNEVGLESTFVLTGQIFEEDSFSSVRGRYTILQGAPGQEIIIQAHGSMMVYSASDRKKIQENLKNAKNGNVKPYAFKPEHKEVDLFFTSDGVNKLVLVDDDFEPVADDSRYTLYKRDRLFTAEGYITFDKGRIDFIDENTSEEYHVAPLGVYGDAQKSYDSIATEYFEGVYLKAVAYSVMSDSSDEDLLVIKSIIEMKKSDAYTNKEKAIFLGNN
jgi:hypothetical protein